MRSDISLFWYRRLCEGTALIGLAQIAFFAWTFITSRDFTLSSIAASVIAALAICYSLVVRIRQPGKLHRGALAVFVLLVASVVSLTSATGGLYSPFVAVWLLIALISGAVGLTGIILTLWVNVIYIAVAVLFGWWRGPSEQLAVIFITSLFPLAVSLFLWHLRLFSASRAGDEISHLSERLSREANKSAIIINAIAEGVIVVNRRGLVQLINPAGQQLTGWEQKDAIELDYRSVLKFTTELDKPLTGDDPVQQVLKSNKPIVNNNLTLTTHGNKKILLSVVASPLSSGKEAVGVIVVFRDVTKEKAEEREKAEFISTASHEMRTPVASIEGYLALAMNKQVAVIDEKARTYLEKAHEATQHLGRLFQDLLTISRAEDGRLTNNPKLIDVVAFVQKLWEGQKPKAEAKKLQYIFLPNQVHGTAAKVVRPIFYASIDPDRLSEVINNLIDNAIKYTPEGQVSIDITADAERIIVSIKDSGVGIPKEDIPHLFQKFYRVDNSFTREVGGTGLGLFISRRIMEQSGGQLWVESEEGKGSTFFVQIPRIDNEKAAFLRQQITPTDASATSQAPSHVPDNKATMSTQSRPQAKESAPPKK